MYNESITRNTEHGEDTSAFKKLNVIIIIIKS